MEDVRSHILQYLYRKKMPVTPGDIKSRMLGAGISYDDLFNSLWNLNYIATQDNQIFLSEEGQYQLAQQEKKETERIHRLVFEQEFNLAVLEFLVLRETLVHLEDFPKLLKDHAQGHGYGDDPIHDVLFKLEQKGYVHNPYSQWYGSTETGKAYYQHTIKKFENGSSQINGSDKQGSDFSESDKQEMNRKLDQILEELAKVHAANEAIWTDMKADFEELRNLYGLNKKTWRQLLIGKIAEWTAGGVVSETISKGIVDFIKPFTGQLLG